MRLLSLLQAHQHWSAATLAARLEVTTRTVRADVQRLRSLGYDIDAAPGVAGGYRLRAGTTMPELLLDDDEAVAVAIGLRTAAAAGVTGIGEHAGRAAAKLEGLLPGRPRHRLRTLSLSAVADTVPNSRDPVPGEALAAVAAACERHEQLRLGYTDRHQASSRRRVEPHRLVHVSGRWYLVAYDLDREDWRSLRVDRISPKTPTGPRFTPRELPGPDLAVTLAGLDLTLVPNDDIGDVLVAQSRQLAHEQARLFATMTEVVYRRPFAGPLEVRRGETPELYGADEIRA
ncbi:MAG: WYL domain-containing protein, partial [Pseudonocardia sp.]|nr:WYL domain-containing protein [Pseudonocardia sp.]